LIRGIGRLIRQRKNQRIVEIVVAPTVTFNIFIDVRYSHVKIVGDEVALRMSNASLRKLIKKFDVISIKEEHAMLSQAFVNPLFLMVLMSDLGIFVFTIFSFAIALNFEIWSLNNLFGFNYLLIWY
jgi:hypothetical protein